MSERFPILLVESFKSGRSHQKSLIKSDVKFKELISLRS